MVCLEYPSQEGHGDYLLQLNMIICCILLERSLLRPDSYAASKLKNSQA